MSDRRHKYTVDLVWTGNTGTGTASYRSYERAHEIRATGKEALLGSSDPFFRGDRTRWNPEELLVSALASCHMLAYLHLCAVAGITVTAYTDAPQGHMVEKDAGGSFTSVVLRPEVTILQKDLIARAIELHHQAHKDCFIASSVNFPVTCEPQVQV